MTEGSESESERLLRSIATWTDKRVRTDEFRKFKVKAIAYTLDHDDPFSDMEKPQGHFKFDEELEREHDLVMKYYQMLSAVNGLKQMEFYFRRYPFAGMGVSRADHLRNMCEMYFNHFYMFRERMKAALNTLNNILPTGRLDVGSVIKSYTKEFDRELRERNGVHHHESFDDVAIDKVMLTELLTMAKDVDDPKHWRRREHLSAYRRASREWAERARTRAKRVDSYAEAVAGAILTHAAFLTSEHGGADMPESVH
ncbi:hypothetical protein [Brevundimonas sp.]|uniref:hypothetical protein n=1 Tax=Brevundimonas sp. TaxID=1871086 RepID=UPI0035B0C4CB